MASKSTRASNDKLEIEDDVRSVRSDSTAEYPEEPVRRGSEGIRALAWLLHITSEYYVFLNRPEIHGTDSSQVSP